MSRAVYHSEYFDYAFGVDRATGAFFQVFEKGNDEETLADYDAAYGVRIHSTKELEEHAPQALLKIKEYQGQWSKEYCNFTESHIIALGLLLRIRADREEFERKVFELWD